MIVVEACETVPRVARAEQKALLRTLSRMRKAIDLHGAVTVLLTDDAHVRALNRRFRGKNRATDVLSFPADSLSGVAGDLAVSLETAARQATEHDHSLLVELRILMLHGILHLSGMDHECDGGEMVALESALRARFRLPAGLIERTLQERVSSRTPKSGKTR